ncbi:MAG: YfgM family protein [Wenzhouxiangella sp.]
MAVELYDEHEQGERVRKWIREYGISIVAGLVLAFGGIFGFRYWQDHQANQKVLAANLFTVIQTHVDAGRTEQAAEGFSELQAAAPRSAFVGLGAVMLASAHVEAGRLQAAADLYQEVLDKRHMQSLWPIARLRLARVLEAQGDLSQALNVLDAVPAPAGHEAAWAELRGDLLFAKGRLGEAQTAFEQALQLTDDRGFNRRLLQMKIDATAPDSAGEQS